MSSVLKASSSRQEPARILQHSSSPVTFDPPRNSVEAAIRENERERLQIAASVRAQAERDAGKLQLLLLIDTYGFDTVALWVRNIGASLGPLHGTSAEPNR